MSEDPLGLLGGDVNLFVYVMNNPTNLIDPAGLWGFGATAGGTAAGGLGPVGPSAAATASSSFGIFGGGSQGVNFGGFSSLGAFVGVLGSSVGYPSDASNFAAGGFAGLGGGAFITNATSAADLQKTTGTVSLDIGILYKVSIQVSYGGGIWSISGTVGPGYGLALTHLATKTSAYPRAK